MIIVNLLPEHLRPIKRTPIPYIVTSLLLIGAIMAMGVVGVAQLQKSSAKQAQLKKTKSDLENYGDVVNEYNTLQNQKIELAKKIGIINAIVGDRIVWSYQLWKLSSLTPDNIWYKAIRVVEKQFKETKFVPDPKKKKKDDETIPLVEKTETVKKAVLEIEGNVIKDKNGLEEVYPLTRKTVDDKEFSKLFELQPPTLKWDMVNENVVRGFTLEYLILTMGEDAK